MLVFGLPAFAFSVIYKMVNGTLSLSMNKWAIWGCPLSPQSLTCFQLACSPMECSRRFFFLWEFLTFRSLLVPLSQLFWNVLQIRNDRMPYFQKNKKHNSVHHFNILLIISDVCSTEYRFKKISVELGFAQFEEKSFWKCDDNIFSRDWV